MSAAILNQPWEDVADDVTGAIEKAVQPLLKKAVDDIYGGLLDATQDYLRENVAFNIASRIDCAERQALSDRQDLAREKQKTEALLEALDALLHTFVQSKLNGGFEPDRIEGWSVVQNARAAMGARLEAEGSLA